MPQYDYINDKTGEIITLIQGMNDKHEYFDKSGKKWRRIFYKPQANLDVKIDPFSSQQFIDKTGRGSDTLGAMVDRAKEYSEKRKELTGGVDPIKERSIQKWKRDRRRKDGSLPRFPGEARDREINIS